MHFDSYIQTRLSTLITTLLILFSLLLAGCNSNTQASTETLPPSPVNVQLSWVHNIEFAGFYMAEEKEYFGAENLAVTLKPQVFDQLVNPIDEVLAGKADFGVTGGSSLLLARAEGKPVVAIAALYQRNPLVLISLAEKNITRPQDLVGKTVLLDHGSVDSVIYTALIAQEQGIESEQVKFVQKTTFGIQPLLDGDADVIDGFINNEPVQLEQQGHKVNLIIPANYGLDMYANVIFTTEEMIAQRPDLVERFVRASVRGIQSAIEDPKSAVTMTTARNSDLNFESEVESMNRSLPLFNPAGSKPGLMTPAIWQGGYQILLDQGTLKDPIELEKAYTLSFLTKVYDNQ
ncbi:MAG: ABC transporter substrate-binding protein [Anaerolineales bacterium]|nr:ABC transporter substrate-binding protein [Anaerolineales bacterium]